MLIQIFGALSCDSRHIFIITLSLFVHLLTLSLVRPDSFVQPETAPLPYQAEVSDRLEPVSLAREVSHNNHEAILVAYMSRNGFNNPAFYELVGVTPFASLGLPLYKNIKMASFNDYLLVSVVTGEDLENQNKTVVFKVYENGTVEFIQVMDPVNLAVQSTAIFHKGEDVRLSLAGDNGVYIYEYSEVDGQFLHIQNIPAMDVFLVEQLEMFGEDILILGLLGTAEGAAGALLTAYRWMGGYFDSFFEYAVPHIRDICPFEIQGHFFLAVAVREIGKTDPFHDLSFIMRYDLHADAFVVDQYIPTHGARDFEFFSISSDKDQEFFLVLASDQLDQSGNERSIVYKYIWHKFVPFQCFETHGATKWQPVTKVLDVVLILASSHGIVFYQYDGWRFTEVGLPMLDVSLESEIQSFSAVVLNGTEYLAISSVNFLDRNSRATIFQLEFNATNTLGDYQNMLEGACLDEHKRLDKAVERIQNVTAELPKLVYVDVNYTQEISGNITFKENIIAGDTAVEGDLSAQVGHIFNETEAERFREMEELADEQSEDIDWLKDRMDNMMKTIGVQTVTAQKTFYDFTSTSELGASSVAVSSDTVNRFINLTDVNSNIFRVDQNETVTAPITVGGSVLFSDGLHVNGRIDGVLTDDLVTLTGNHTIVSPKTFGSTTNFSGDVDVDGLIDGVNISAEDILLTSSNQTIAGDLTFNETVTFRGSVTVDGEVDGVDISEMEAVAVYKNGTSLIEGLKTFEDEVTSQEGLSAAGKTVDAVSVDEMDANILRITTEQNVTGTYTFSSDVHLVGNLLVVGTTNSLVIPDDLLLSDSSEFSSIPGSTTFTASLRLSDLTVKEAIDGVTATNVSAGESLSLLLVSAEDGQVLAGQVTLTESLLLMADTTVTGSVDGVDLSELSADALRDEDNATITGLKTIEGPVDFSQAISVEGLINDVNITDVDSRVLRITDSEWMPEGDLTLSAATTRFTTNLETYGNHSFGGLQLTDLAMQGVNDTIAGHKFFQNVHSQSTINMTGAVNDVRVDRVCRDAVYLNTTEALTLHGDIIFEEDLTIDGHLTVNGTIDGVSLEEVVTVEGTQRIAGSTTFHPAVQVEELLVNSSVKVDGTVNSKNVTEIALDTLYTHGVQTITGHKAFLENAIFNGDLELGGSVNAIDISELALDAVYQTGDHAISAPKTLTAEASVGSINIQGSINGGNFTEFCEDIVLLGENQTINGAITFEQTVKLNSSLALDGTLNGVDLDEFNATAQKITDDELTGPLHFADVFANASVNADGLVAGIDVGDDTLIKDKEGQTVTGAKTFTSSLSLGDDLNSTTVNSLGIQVLDSSVLKTLGDQNVTGYYKFWDGVTWLSNCTIGGLIDGVDIVELANSIWRTDGDTDDYTLNVTGNGTFSILTSKDIYYNGTIDGVDIPELNRTYVSLSSDQTITGSKRFLGTVVVDNTADLTTDHIEVRGSIRDLDLLDISDEALISGNAGQEMEGELTFVEDLTLTGDVTVDGFIDGVDISDDVMMTKTTNIVIARKTFDNSLMEIDASLIVDGGKRVQTVDVSEMARLSADLYSNHTIPHSTSFTNLTLQNLSVGGQLNGINYTASYVLTTRHNQFIHGNCTFMTDTSFSTDVNATTINNLDVVDLAENTLFMTGDQTVTGNITLNGLLLSGNVTTHGRFGGIVVTDLYHRLHLYPQLDNLGVTLDEQCQVLDEIYYTQQNQAVLFRGLERIYGEVTTGRVIWVPYQTPSGIYAALAVSPEYDEYRRTINPQVCSTLSIKRWGSRQERYLDDRQMTFDLIRDVKLILGAEIEGVVVAERTVDGSCFNISQFGYNITEVLDEYPPGYTTPAGFWVHVMFTNDIGEPFHQRLLGVGTSTLEVFSHDEDLCILVGNEADHATWNTAVDSFIYCFNSSSGAFQFTLSVPTFGIVKAASYSHSGNTYLLVANRADSISGSHRINSTLWNFINSSHVQEVGRFPTRAASYVTTGEVNGMRLIVYLNEFGGDYMFENYWQDIDVYRFDTAGTELFQKISFYGAKAATFLKLERMDFLAVIDRNGNLTLFKYEGIQQFVEYYTLHLPGATDIAVMTLRDGSAIHLFVATALAEPLMFPWQPTIPVPSPSEVFQVALSGHILDAVSCSSAPSSHDATDVTSLMHYLIIHLLYLVTILTP